MFSRSVSSNSALSCVTTENWSRSTGSVKSATGTPPSVTWPASGSTMRDNRLNTVDFPAPDGPTSAVVRPAWAVNVSPRSTGCSP